jgi:hypothetical protein
MTTSPTNNANVELPPASVLRVGFYAALVTAVITLVTFGFAINAVPTSGANCLADCFNYPYLDTISQFPKDYIWMPLAILMILAYVVLMVSIQGYASRDRKIFGQIGLSFAIMAALFLVGDYFVQFSVIPVSLMHGETEGITLLTQYNSHGPFIVLEELGYLMMTLSFLFIAPVFAGKNRLEGAIRWILIISFVLAMVSLTLISINHGLNRQDRFEVIIISIDWLVLVINGILWSILFKKQLKSKSM